MEAISINVLLVEGDPVLRDLMKLALSRLDPSKYTCQVVTTQDEKETLAFVRKVHLDLVLLDVFLPQFNGLQLLKQLRKEPSMWDVPIIILSSLAYREIVEQALESGATDFLIKPLNVDLFMARVLDALDRGKNYRTKQHRLES